MQSMKLFTSLIAIVLPLFSAGPLRAADEFHWVNQPQEGTADLLYGDQPVLRYMYGFDSSTDKARDETVKVYHHVFGPGTKTLITKGPGGLYPHHRGLFVGWNKTSFEGGPLDFWHCKKGEHQRHHKLLMQSGDASQGLMSSEIHWNDADGKPVIIETRTVTAHSGSVGNGWQIDWQTSLASQRGRITLDGDRQHAGFQFRAAQSVAESNSARYVRPSGFPEQPEAYEVTDKDNPPLHIDLGWLAMTYTVDGRQYTVEYFEDPSLPKPARYSERPYGRFGAFFKTTLEPDKPLEMRYRLFVTSGPTPSREAIQKRYDEFVAELGKERK
ncbi:MAG: DUF6807 family protein [Planctomycetaceae bacterium]